MKNIILKNSKLNNNGKRFNETISPNFKMIDGSTLSKLSIASMKLNDSSDNDSNNSIDRSLPKIKSTINSYTKMTDMKKLNKINYETNQSTNFVQKSPKLEKDLRNLFKKSPTISTSRSNTNLNINMKSSLPSISNTTPRPAVVAQPKLKQNDVLSSLRLSSIVDQVNDSKSLSQKKQPLIEFLNNFKKENIKFNERRKKLNYNLIHLSSILPNKNKSRLSDLPQKETTTKQIITKNPVNQNSSHSLFANEEKNIQKPLLFYKKNNSDQFSESSETIRLLAPNPSVNTSLRDLNEFNSSGTIKSSDYDDDFDEIEFDFDLNDDESEKQTSDQNIYNHQNKDEFNGYFQMIKNRKLNLIDESAYKYNRFNI
jgi:hypothetical protein